MAESIPTDKVWVSLITNTNYLPGLLTLAHTLRQARSRYPLIALYPASFPASGLSALSARSIPALQVPFLSPRAGGPRYASDPRFRDTWTKLVVFSLTQFSRLVHLDSDMIVRRNIDELLDDDEEEGEGEEEKRAGLLRLEDGDSAVFAASHACVCNPLKRPHYPRDWTPQNCAFTAQHRDPARAQVEGANPSRVGLGLLNSGLLVVRPDADRFDEIRRHMDEHADEYTFPDQDLLADLYRGRWKALPYVYNALKTMRSPDVHGAIWRDDQVKIVHFILSPKPWDEVDEHGQPTKTGGVHDELHKWWFEANNERLLMEKELGLDRA